MDKILVFVEIKGDEVKKVSLELLSEGRKARRGRAAYEWRPSPWAAVGRRSRKSSSPYADTLVHITDPLLDAYTPEGYALALGRLCPRGGAEDDPRGGHADGARFPPQGGRPPGCGIVSDVTAANWLDEPVTFVRPMYGGKVLTEVSCAGYPVIVTTRPNTFDIADAGDTTGRFVERQAALVGRPGADQGAAGRGEGRKAKVDLTEADIIVSGGRGLKAAENFTLLEDLAGRHRRHGRGNEVRRRREMAGPGGPGGQEREDGLAEALYSGRHFRGHPSHHGHGYFEGGPCHQ